MLTINIQDDLYKDAIARVADQLYKQQIDIVDQEAFDKVVETYILNYLSPVLNRAIEEAIRWSKIEIRIHSK